MAPMAAAIIALAPAPGLAPGAHASGRCPGVRELMARDRAGFAPFAGPDGMAGDGAEHAPGLATAAVTGGGGVEERGAGPAASFLGTPGSISPARAFMYSMLVPGTGELAQGSASGFAFLAADVAGWAGVIVYNQRGHDGEDRYRRFVDQHYSKAQYDGVVAQVYREFNGGDCLEPGATESVFVCIDLAAYFSLDEDTHSGHYYEDVGKLDKYIFGWLDWADTTGDGMSDYDPATTPVSFGGTWTPAGPWPAGFPGFASSLRAEYQDLRRSANRNFSHADKFSWMLVLNRVVSAVHAAWMARQADTDDRAGDSPEARLVLDPVRADGSLRVALARSF